MDQNNSGSNEERVKVASVSLGEAVLYLMLPLLQSHEIHIERNYWLWPIPKGVHCDCL